MQSGVIDVSVRVVRCVQRDLVRSEGRWRRHAGARRLRHAPTSRALTPRAREDHAPPRARCVITRRSLAEPAKQPAPIGRPPSAHLTFACLVPRALTARFIRLLLAIRTTRLPKAEPRNINTSFVN